MHSLTHKLFGGRPGLDKIAHPPSGKALHAKAAGHTFVEATR